MRKKLRQKLTPLQQRQLRNMIVILLVIVVVWILVAPNMGLWSLYMHRRHVQELYIDKEKLEKENETLRKEIDRLENDMQYFERLARDKGLLREDEVVIDFGENAK